MSQSIREFMGIGAQGIGASQPAKKPGLRETFKEFFKKDNLKRAMATPIPRTISQGVGGLMDVYNRGRLPGESKMSFVDLLKDDLRQITVSDKDFKAGKTGITSMKPFKAFTPKMMATGPTPLVRQTVERALGPVGALATAGQVGYGVGNILMDVTGTRDDVSAAGAALANTQLGQQLAGALGVPQTPNIQSQIPSPQQGIATVSPSPLGTELIPREFRKVTLSEGTLDDLFRVNERLLGGGVNFGNTGTNVYFTPGITGKIKTLGGAFGGYDQYMGDQFRDYFNEFGINFTSSPVAFSDIPSYITTSPAIGGVSEFFNPQSMFNDQTLGEYFAQAGIPTFGGR